MAESPPFESLKDLVQEADDPMQRTKASGEAQAATAAPAALALASPWRTFGLTSIAVFLVSLDATIGFAAFPALRESFRAASAADLSWVLNAYTIVFAALLAPAGRLADLVGRKRFFLAGVALFTLGSALCGLAPGLATLVTARVLQAIGAALLTPTSLALILHAFPVQKRAVAVSLWGALGALAAALGPSAGAAIIDASSWRWAFLINVPFGIFALVRAARALPESRNPESGAQLDLPGILLVIAAVFLITLGIVQSEQWGWASANTLASIGAGLVLCVVFVGWARGRAHAAIDLSLFAEKSYLFERQTCQRRLKFDPLSRLVAEVNLTHLGSLDRAARTRRA